MYGHLISYRVQIPYPCRFFLKNIFILIQNYQIHIFNNEHNHFSPILSLKNKHNKFNNLWQVSTKALQFFMCRYKHEDALNVFCLLGKNVYQHKCTDQKHFPQGQNILLTKYPMGVFLHTYIYTIYFKLIWQKQETNSAINSTNKYQKTV